MVDIGIKTPMKRRAKSQGRIIVGEEILRRIQGQGKMKKGDILTVSKVAGIMGAKHTSQLIPLCHQIPLDNIYIDIESCVDTKSLVVTAEVRAIHKTGVEMESLMAVTITLLTLYDMCKSVEKSMSITDIRLVSKEKVSDQVGPASEMN